MTIRVETIKELIEITAGLVRQGVLFNAYKKDNEYWLVEFSGGH